MDFLLRSEVSRWPLTVLLNVIEQNSYGKKKNGNKLNGIFSMSMEYIYTSYNKIMIRLHGFQIDCAHCDHINSKFYEKFIAIEMHCKMEIYLMKFNVICNGLLTISQISFYVIRNFKFAFHHFCR